MKLHYLFRFAFISLFALSGFNPKGQALTTDWAISSAGNFNLAANWDNGAPTASDTAVFRRGSSATYTVSLGSSLPGFPPVVHTIDRLVVGSNNVSLARTGVGSLSLVINNSTTTNSGRGIEVGELGTDNATLNTSIPITAVSATIGDAVGSSGIWSTTSGSVSLTAASTPATLIVGNSGTGNLQASGTTTINSAGPIILANNAGAVGTLSVSGSAAEVMPGAVYVGENGTGNLSITGGGKVIQQSNSFAVVADIAGVSTATVDGSDSEWDAGTKLYIGYQANGTLSVTQGGVVTNTADACIGCFAGATGKVTVDGAGSTWNTNSLTLGPTNNGVAAATLIVSNGGKVVNSSSFSTRDFVVANTTEDMMSISGGGTVTDTGANLIGGGVAVDGAGSAWHTGELTVASFTNALVSITAGAQVTSSAKVHISDLSSSGGTPLGIVNVDGVGSTLTATQSIDVGETNSASLHITNGGHVSSASGTVGDASNSFSAATVLGPGSAWSMAGVLTLGNQGFGRITINGGGLVQSGGGVLGTSGEGLARVDGIGTKWASSGDMFVGQFGDAQLTITGGAQVSNATGYVGSGANLVSTVTVDGQNSQWNNTGDLHIGKGIDDSLYVTGGAQVSNMAGEIGLFANGHATALITGANSKWTNGESLVVGNLGPATVTVGSGGTITVGATTTGSTLAISASGLVSGDGTIVGNVSNGGVLAPGNSLGTLQVSGNVVQLTAGTLQIELGGIAAGSQFDQLAVSGQLTLSGALQISLVNGFAPTTGNSFDLLNWGTRTGTFLSVQLPTLAAGRAWDTTQLYTTGVISVVATAGVPGDYNNNGVVDAADYVAWRKGLGTTYTQNDYNVWRTHFGQTVGSGAGVVTNAAVPEPITLVLLMFAATGWYLRRGRAA